MPRLLSLPLSELFTEPSGAASAESFPSPWHGAPLPIALKARQLAEDAALFSDAPGRRNVLVCRADNDDPAQQSILLITSQSPADFVLPDPNETLPMADRIAGKTSCGAFEEAARSVEILTMAGTRTSLLAFAESDRARRPPKIARGAPRCRRVAVGGQSARRSSGAGCRQKTHGARQHGMVARQRSHIRRQMGRHGALPQNNHQALGGIPFGRHPLCKRSESQLTRHAVPSAAHPARTPRLYRGIQTFRAALRSGHRRTSECLNHSFRNDGHVPHSRPSSRYGHLRNPAVRQNTRRHSITDGCLS